MRTVMNLLKIVVWGAECSECAFCEFLFDRRLSAIFSVEHAYSVENLFFKIILYTSCKQMFFLVTILEKS